MSGVRVVAFATVGIGLVVALAPVLPAKLRSAAIVVMSAAWLVGTAFGTAKGGAQAIRANATEAGDRLFLALGIAGVSVVLLCAGELQLVRWLEHRPALVWNIDWRYHLNHAQGIARFGGVDSALDYAGAPVDYHVGPAWIAGAVQRVTGGGLEAVSFGVIPVACTIAVALMLIALLHGAGLRLPPAVAAVGAAMAAPMLASSPRGIYWGLPGNLVDARHWTFNSGLMLNSYLAMAVGLAAVVLLARSDTIGAEMAAGAAGLASLAALKPPYFASFVALASLLAAVEVLGPPPRGGRRPRGALLMAVCLALVLGALMLASLPHAVSLFGRPDWAPGRTGTTLYEPYRLATAIVSGGLIAYAWLRRRRAIGSRSAGLLGACIVADMALAVLLSTVRFPAKADVVARAHAVGAIDFTRETVQPNLEQGLVPLRLMAVAIALGLILEALRRAGRRPQLLGALGVGIASLSPAGYFLSSALNPLRGHEAAEDAGLLAVLRQLPRDSGLTVASDLADPAEDFARAARAPLLTGYTGRPFYVSNLAYAHFTRPDAAARLDDLQRFFGTAWSPWHQAFLAHAKITAVLVDERCAPIWIAHVPASLRPMAQAAGWVGFAVRPAPDPNPPPASPAARADLHPAFGKASCLRWQSAE